ncbi:MAG: rhomboid family intramembrane serine protease [Bacteroidales bacterium]
MNFWDKLIDNFRQGSVITRLIYINLGLFLVVRLIMAFIVMGGGQPDVILDWLALPADYPRLITRPWTAITYMFLHYHFFHILFNLIALYFFGRLFISYLSEKRLLAVYVLGGLTGGAAYVISHNLINGLDSTSASVLGASGAVYAIMVVIAVISPRQKVYIPFISSIELRWLVLAFIGIDLLSLPVGNNMGGHIAHLGGALFGAVYAQQHKKGEDIGAWFNQLLAWLAGLFKSQSHMRVTYKNTNTKRSKRPETDMEYNARKKKEQDEINRILDKVSNSGYDSLTKREKELLFKNSDKR